MIEFGILDVSTVQKEALYSVIRSASLALTIDAIVNRKESPVVTDPDAPGILAVLEDGIYFSETGKSWEARKAIDFESANTSIAAPLGWAVYWRDY